MPIVFNNWNVTGARPVTYYKTSEGCLAGPMFLDDAIKTLMRECGIHRLNRPSKEVYCASIYGCDDECEDYFHHYLQLQDP